MGSPTDKYDSKGREKIQCRKCGCWFHRLDVHLTTRHGINVAQYQAEFPGSPTISQAARKSAQSAQSTKAAAPIKPAQTVQDDDPEIFKIGVARLKMRVDLADMDKLYVPANDPNWVFSEREMRDWEALAIAIQEDVPAFLGGPCGSGKTESVRQLAACLNQPCVRIQLNRDFRASEFVGHTTLAVDKATGQQVTVWQDGIFTQCLKNNWWVILDEMDQAHPDVLMKIQAVLEGQPLVLTENFGEIVSKGEHTRIFATANTFGFGDETGMFAGAKTINEATMDRFGVVIKRDYPVKEIEIDIVSRKSGMAKGLVNKMVTIAQKVREAGQKDECRCTFSTRRLIQWALMAAKLNDIRRAATITVLDRVDREDSAFMDSLIQRYFGGDIQ